MEFWLIKSSMSVKYEHIHSRIWCIFVLLLFSSLGVQSQEYPLPMVLVVHQSNKISHLEKKDVIDIYMGRFKTFPDGNPAQPIDFPASSIEKSVFYQRLVGKSERNINAYWSRLLFSGRATPPLKATSKSDVINRVGAKSLAYLHAGDVTKEMKIVYKL